ncbi:MAG: hypothetical protein KJO49_08940 [Bacteroidia bacterium]|nr:hypothetical protein [Bacteroidia bacterium]MBT8268689.1 hypothetical protein [Bacteroidia bacterium]NNF81286.1 hypothetical protein [Flavobacteriaceae bacterium]NNL81310.1 hypothetical protein [Flavobacteriaceae bacterium]
MPITLQYSIKELRRNTNDSTYIPSVMKFQAADGSVKELDIELRVRGNYRLKNCYYPPLKIKIKKSNYKGTLFDTHKRLKLVTPCLTERDKNDNVIKEYIAYKIYELVSPFYFKSRLVDLEFNEVRGNNKIKAHTMKAFLIEDDKHVAKRYKGKIYKRRVHPMQQNALASVRHAMFQYLIGNTDFSQYDMHNVKVMFHEKEFLPIPYDFDMAGLVNCSYAVVSQIGKEKLPLSSVTQRLYRGFERNPALFEQLRKEYLSFQPQIMGILSETKDQFQHENEYNTARDYIIDFFKVLSDEKKFQKQILNKARTE